jgi:hypothetical protein
MAVTAKTRKKLIEVSIPLEVINRESAREKSIRHGHPSTLHLWWARRRWRHVGRCSSRNLSMGAEGGAMCSTGKHLY